MSALADRNFRRILLIKPSSLGDVLHGVPVLWALRRRYPRARIAWLVASSFAPLIEGIPTLDEVIRFDRAKYRRVGRSIPVTISFARFAADLRRRRFDLIIDLQGLFRSGFLAWTSGAAVRIGFGQAREIAWAFYTHRIPPIRGDAHAVDRNFRVTELLGCAEAPIDLSLPVRPEARDSLQSKLAELGLPAGTDFAAVAPGARWETKLWRPESFAAVIDILHDRLGARSVLLGSPQEIELCHRVASSCRSRPITLVGRTSLPELVAAVGAARVILCNDSGTKDVAVALGKPLVTVYGPTNPRRTSPYGRNHDLFRADIPCSPCYLKKLSQCRFQHRCMHEVAPQPVAERLIDLWEHPMRYNVVHARNPDLAAAST
jgi:lipopolysaccharide heptosyltransferase I